MSVIQIIPSGLRGFGGLAQLSNGSVTVTTDKITDNSKILLTYYSKSGVTGTLSPDSITPGVSFDINSGNILDNSTVTWMILE